VVMALVTGSCAHTVAHTCRVTLMSEDGCMKLTPTAAREFWDALMDNATRLIQDARTLYEAGSFARARSLTVLAQEELGKALWVYEAFNTAWSEGRHDEMDVKRLDEHGTRHAIKYMDAYVFGGELEEFWGHYGTDDYPKGDSEEDWRAWASAKRNQAEAAGKQANAEKMRGFYADINRKTGNLEAPSDIGADTIEADLQRAAQVIEMLLIKDHTRMKHDASTPYESTHEQQFRLLPISHPEDWAAATESFRQGQAEDHSGSPTVE